VVHDYAAKERIEVDVLQIFLISESSGFKDVFAESPKVVQPLKVALVDR
jgi:hypothetical protein